MPVFLIIGFGYAAVWSRAFSAEGTDGLMWFAQGFAIPCMLFRSVSQMDIGSGFDFEMLASFYAGSIAAFLLGLLGTRFLFGRPWVDCVVIGFAALFSNTVLLGLAVVGRAYGSASLEASFAIVAFHAPFCYLMGITAMEFVRNRSASIAATARSAFVSIAKNPIMIGIFLGFAFNLLGVSLPVLFAEALDMVGQAAIPAALFALGGVLVRYKPEGELKVIAWICFLGLAVHPLLTWALSARSFDLEQDLVRSAVVTAAMAPGINTYIFANMYGRAKRVVASSILLGTAASIATVPGWILLTG